MNEPKPSGIAVYAENTEVIANRIDTRAISQSEEKCISCGDELPLDGQ